MVNIISIYTGTTDKFVCGIYYRGSVRRQFFKKQNKSAMLVSLFGTDVDEILEN